MITRRTLRRGDYPGFSGWVQCDHRFLKRRRQEGQKQKRRWSDRSRSQRERFENAMRSVLKMEEEAISQGTQENSSRSWKNPEKRYNLQTINARILNIQFDGVVTNMDAPV